MSALHRLKAYFGMVPADELDEYAYAGHGHQDDEYGPDYADGYRDDRRGERRDDRHDRHEEDQRYRQRLGGRPSRWSDHDSGRDYDEYYDDEPEAPARRNQARRGSWAAEAPVRGALAVEPARETRPAVAAAPADTAVVTAAAGDGHPMSRITTLHPRNFTEARTIGECYRDGIPVIMNLTAMEDADARRLVDFAAGLAFGLRGSIDKVTTKVFLISPANVDVTAEDRRRIAEGSFLPPHFKHA